MKTSKEWTTGDGRPLTQDEITEICELARQGMPTEAIGQQFGRTSGWAWAVLNNEQWVFGRRADGKRGWMAPDEDAELLANVWDEEDDVQARALEEARGLIQEASAKVETWKSLASRQSTILEQRNATIGDLTKQIEQLQKEVELYRSAAQSAARRQRAHGYGRLLQQDMGKLRHALEE